MNVRSGAGASDPRLAWCDPINRLPVARFLGFGVAPLALDTGESVYFDGRIGHAILANGHTPCRALLIVAGDETPSPQGA